MSPDSTGIRLTGDVRAAGDDFDALYELSRPAYRDPGEDIEPFIDGHRQPQKPGVAIVNPWE